eukprot:scaffold32672_cov69-Cyclotella_meneghiniana.AAC.2
MHRTTDGKKKSYIWEFMYEINIREAFVDSDLCNNSKALQKAMRSEVKCCILCKYAGKSLWDSLYTVKEGKPANANSHIQTQHKEHYTKAKDGAVAASSEKRKNEVKASPKKRVKSALATQKAPSDESKEDECKRQADIIKQQADVIKIQEEEITRLSADIERYKKALAAFT